MRDPDLRAMLWAGGATFLLDQASKGLVVDLLDLRSRGEVVVWPGLLALRMAWNEGVNFGLAASLDMRWVLVGVAVLISALVVVWVRRERAGRVAHVSAGLLVGGALGNVVDRLRWGAVADFLNFPFFGDALGWLGRKVGMSLDAQYSFNVADIAVFVGAAGLVLLSGRAAPPARRGDARRGPR